MIKALYVLSACTLISIYCNSGFGSERTKIEPHYDIEADLLRLAIDDVRSGQINRPQWSIARVCASESDQLSKCLQSDLIRVGDYYFSTISGVRSKLRLSRMPSVLVRIEAAQGEVFATLVRLPEASRTWTVLAGPALSALAGGFVSMTTAILLNWRIERNNTQKLIKQAQDVFSLFLVDTINIIEKNPSGIGIDIEQSLIQLPNEARIRCGSQIQKIRQGLYKLHSGEINYLDLLDDIQEMQKDVDNLF
jgi:hypothetical protein